MSKDINKSNPNDSQLNNVVKDLTHVVEKEVKAFHSLFEVLLQQGLLIPSQAENNILQMNPQKKQAKHITNSQMGPNEPSQAFSHITNNLSQPQLAPIVEKQYVQRLGELKDVLYALSDKVQNTNKRNQSLLENSLKRVNNCLHVLEQGYVIASNQKEKLVNNERSSYRGAE